MHLSPITSPIRSQGPKHHKIPSVAPQITKYYAKPVVGPMAEGEPRDSSCKMSRNYARANIHRERSSCKYLNTSLLKGLRFLFLQQPESVWVVVHPHMGLRHPQLNRQELEQGKILPVEEISVRYFRSPNQLGYSSRDHYPKTQKPQQFVLLRELSSKRIGANVAPRHHLDR